MVPSPTTMATIATATSRATTSASLVFTGLSFHPYDRTAPAGVTKVVVREADGVNFCLLRRDAPARDHETKRGSRVAEPHICDLNWRTSDPQQEWVKVVNAGLSTQVLTGRRLTDETETQADPHIYVFPRYNDGAPIQLTPGERVFVVIGVGEGGWRPVDGVNSLVLYWGLRACVWNNSGDVAYLRESDGRIIDYCTVGNPPRHPGH